MCASISGVNALPQVAESKGICVCKIHSHTHTHRDCFSVPLLIQGTSERLALCQSNWEKKERHFSVSFHLHCSYYERVEDFFICVLGGWALRTASSDLSCLARVSNWEAPGGDWKVGEIYQSISFLFLLHPNAMLLMVAICLHIYSFLWAICHPPLLFSLNSSNNIFPLCALHPEWWWWLPALAGLWVSHHTSFIPFILPLNLSPHLKTVSCFCVLLRHWHTNPLPIFLLSCLVFSILIYSCRNSLCIRAKNGKLFL